ncbi:MAG: arginine--tRNA ligase [Thermoprotei archaeon]
MSSPFGAFKNDVLKYLAALGISPKEQRLEVPPSITLGHLAFPMFELKEKPSHLPSPSGLVAEVSIKNGYMNFKANISALASLLNEQIEDKREDFASLKIEGNKVIIEHTSANPLHPMHIGHARNAFLGDSLARLMRARGHNVSTHFYVDDMGVQVMIAAIGYRIAPEMPKGIKPDHWIGFVYAVSNIMYELAEVREKLKSNPDDYSSLIQKQDELVGYASSLREKLPKEFDAITSALSNITFDDWNKEIARTLRGLESGDNDVKNLVRQMVGLALEGFRQTLDGVGVRFDQWDWESDLTSADEIAALIAAVRSSPFAISYKGVLAIDCKAVMEARSLKPETAIKEVQPLVLLRSDGTTLYQTRDIIYSLKKLALADEVYNVIGAEQSVAQLQVKLALYAVNHPRAGHLHHVPYEMVRLPGKKMSGRYGSYVTLDEVVSTAVALAKKEIKERNEGLDERELANSAQAIGIGAVKYALLSVNAQKVVDFQLEKALNFDENSAPFIQYAAVRAKNLVAKGEEKGLRLQGRIDFSTLSDDDEKRIVLLCSRLPDVSAYAADSIHVESLASHLMEIANVFNSYYSRVPILSSDGEVAEARLALSRAVYWSLRSGLKLLGIDVPDRM